jgi:hypothetical protein
MDELTCLIGAQDARFRTIPLHGWALGPVNLRYGRPLLRDKAGDGPTSLRDHNFLSGANPIQKTGVMVS